MQGSRRQTTPAPSTDVDDRGLAVRALPTLTAGATNTNSACLP